MAIERVYHEDKTHSTGQTMSDPDILMPKEAWYSQLPRQALGWSQHTLPIIEVVGSVLKKGKI